MDPETGHWPGLLEGVGLWQEHSSPQVNTQRFLIFLLFIPLKFRSLNNRKCRASKIECFNSKPNNRTLENSVKPKDDEGQSPKVPIYQRRLTFNWIVLRHTLRKDLGLEHTRHQLQSCFGANFLSRLPSSNLAAPQFRFYAQDYLPPDLNSTQNLFGTNF